MTQQEMTSLNYLMDKAKKVSMTPDEQVAQRRSFAYGNSAFENPNITKAIVAEEDERISL
ncbi:hypothetical protein [Tateyamaria sp.]|jgi:hypothetical protein|uniref:hypothetical protein n=1 Tax=Tateyamaria sp. TaxID=1929288 RepID=UPI0032DCB537|tara:strand:- start:1195 stop:1374 length:180 start_codon:yes stop_codon:yes gene_type:complete